MVEQEETKKDGAYDRGFLDASETLLHFAQEIIDTIPENERFSKMLRTLEHVYGCAVERYEEDVKIHFMISRQPWKTKKKGEQA